MARLWNILRNHEGVEWAAYLRATLLCVVPLVTGMLLEASGVPGEYAVLLYGASFAAGLRYTLPSAARVIAAAGIDVDFLMILVALGAWQLGHPEEGAALLVLFNGSRVMESYARERTHSSIAALTREMPQTATRLLDGHKEEIPVEEIAGGDILVIRPGEKFPVDCELIEGRTSVDLSAITGEAEPMVPVPGADIPSGAVNGMGLVKVCAERPARESAYQKIMALIEQAPSRRSPAEVLSDRIGRQFTIAILLLASGAFLLWWLVAQLAPSEAAYRAMVLLVAGSPCAIVLSIPSAILAAIASGARRGILFNGGVGLASLERARAVAFDKTGTLSTGIPGVVKVAGVDAGNPAVLGVAYELARSSTHPASQAVVRYFREVNNNRVSQVLEQVNEQAGRGMGGLWQGEAVALGRPRGCDIFDDEDPEYSRVILYIGHEARLRFYLSESPREDAAEAVHELKRRGLRPFLISGDVQPAVERMARHVGIDDARGELSPEDKWRIVREENMREPVIMVGDGVNDAPALAEATVGVAMGVRGSAATLAEADLILVKDRLLDLVAAVDLGHFTQRIIRQNLSIAIGAAALMLAVAAFGWLPLALGVFGHEGGTVLVVLNSLRLLLERRGAKRGALGEEKTGGAGGTRTHE